MAANYIESPSTDKGDVSVFPNHNLDMSFAQPFASPHKNAGEDLRHRMKGLRTPAQPTKTPRVRNPLIGRQPPNGAQKQEFTPLLKSAKRNKLLQQSILEEKENDTSGVLDTPAGFRSSYGSKEDHLPVDSSILHEEDTGSSANGTKDATPVPPAQSSSMVDSTPIPQLPNRGEGGVFDQGNVLTLRDQEAKLDQIQKDNFSLKLKIHYLEEALKKTGNAFQQATLRENVELKTQKITIEQDLKRQRKRLENAEHELEEYRTKFKEYQESVKKRHMTARDAEEIDRLQKMAEESQKVADEREEELEELRRRLEEADKEQQASDEVQQLKDDMQDLEYEIRGRDQQLEEKDEQLEALQDQLKDAKSGTQQAEHLQQDIEELEAELKEKDEELDSKDRRIAELEERINSAYDREKSTKKLRSDVADLEIRLREREQELEETDEQRRVIDRRFKCCGASAARG
jgi:myosin heavy subunit